MEKTGAARHMLRFGAALTAAALLLAPAAEAYSYSLVSFMGGCGVQNQLHQRCECTTPDSQVCRNYCDADTTCVGYAQGGYGSTCDFYQTSGTCPSQCSLKSVGVVGPIDSYPGMDYFGCHVVRLTPVTENPTIYFNGGGGGFGMPSYSPTWSPVFPLSNSPTERPTMAPTEHPFSGHPTTCPTLSPTSFSPTSLSPTTNRPTTGGPTVTRAPSQTPVTMTPSTRAPATSAPTETSTPTAYYTGTPTIPSPTQGPTSAPTRVLPEIQIQVPDAVYTTTDTVLSASTTHPSGHSAPAVGGSYSWYVFLVNDLNLVVENVTLPPDSLNTTQLVIPAHTLKPLQNYRVLFVADYRPSYSDAASATAYFNTTLSSLFVAIEEPPSNIIVANEELVLNASRSRDMDAAAGAIVTGRWGCNQSSTAYWTNATTNETFSEHYWGACVDIPPTINVTRPLLRLPNGSLSGGEDYVFFYTLTVVLPPPQPPRVAMASVPITVFSKPWTIVNLTSFSGGKPIQVSERVSPTRAIRLSAACTPSHQSSSTVSDLEFVWSVVPDPGRALPAGANSSVLELPGDFLAGGVLYTFTVNITDPDTVVTTRASQAIQVAERPSIVSVSVTPLVGVQNETVFTIRVNASSAEGTLAYSYASVGSTPGTGSQAIAGLVSNSTWSTFLQAGTRAVIVTARDPIGSIVDMRSENLTVTLFPPTAAPTVSPSAAPSTRAPTDSPQTGVPSFAPSSGVPSLSPTKAPSISPQTLAPVWPPSISPTRSPTVGPTAAPTRSPRTGTPSTTPTTTEPTGAPSRSPSRSPRSLAPSRAPSVAPTAWDPCLPFMGTLAKLKALLPPSNGGNGVCGQIDVGLGAMVDAGQYDQSLQVIANATVHVSALGNATEPCAPKLDFGCTATNAGSVAGVVSVLHSSLVNTFRRIVGAPGGSGARTRTIVQIMTEIVETSAPTREELANFSSSAGGFIGSTPARDLANAADGDDIGRLLSAILRRHAEFAATVADPVGSADCTDMDTTFGRVRDLMHKAGTELALGGTPKRIAAGVFDAYVFAASGGAQGDVNPNGALIRRPKFSYQQGSSAAASESVLLVAMRWASRELDVCRSRPGARLDTDVWSVTALGGSSRMGDSVYFVDGDSIDMSFDTRTPLRAGRTAVLACEDPKECRWWNAALGEWDASGCVYSQGSCSCTHLTEFAVVTPLVECVDADDGAAASALLFILIPALVVAVAGAAVLLFRHRRTRLDRSKVRAISSEESSEYRSSEGGSDGERTPRLSLASDEINSASLSPRRSVPSLDRSGIAFQSQGSGFLDLPGSESGSVADSLPGSVPNSATRRGPSPGTTPRLLDPPRVAAAAGAGQLQGVQMTRLGVDSKMSSGEPRPEVLKATSIDEIAETIARQVLSPWATTASGGGAAGGDAGPGTGPSGLMAYDDSETSSESEHDSRLSRVSSNASRASSTVFAGIMKRLAGDYDEDEDVDTSDDGSNAGESSIALSQESDPEK